MATLEEVKDLWTNLDAKAQVDLYTLALTNAEAFCQRIIQISADHGLTITADDIKTMGSNAAVQQFILDLSENDEFDDVELDEAALSAVSGGKSQRARDMAGPPVSEWAVSKPGFHSKRRGGS